MKILIISKELWSENNNGGNVLSNIFSDFDAEFAQIYCSPGIPNNKICKKYFQITDNMIVNNLLSNKKVGKSLIFQDYPYKPERVIVSDVTEGKWYFRIYRKYRLSFFEILRECLWKASRWKTKELAEFLLNFNPDLIFAPCYSNMFMLRLDRYVKKLTGVNMISYVSDDVYSLRQFNLSPFYWLNRLLTRRAIKKTFNDYNLIYTMTDEQYQELSKLSGANMKVLRKGGYFYGDGPKKKINEPIRMVYAGGIYLNRWKILSKIGEVIKQLNKEKIRIRLDIYTQNETTEKQKRLLDDGKNIFLHPAVDQTELANIYKKSDIALHVESFELKYRLLTRLSFSSKIVDCLGSSCAVMAIAWKEHAGLKYLKKEDAAICIDNLSNLYDKLKEIIERPELIIEYAKKAWECGKRNHQIDLIRKGVYEDFLMISSRNKSDKNVK